MKTNPMLAASALAKVLESDPITTSQIKEQKQLPPLSE